jgi:hypothetical protein
MSPPVVVSMVMAPQPQSIEMGNSDAEPPNIAYLPTKAAVHEPEVSVVGSTAWEQGAMKSNSPSPVPESEMAFQGQERDMSVSPNFAQDLILKQSKFGLGVFAGRPFLRGEVIYEFGGTRYTRENAPAALLSGAEPCHFIQIDHNLYLGPSGGVDDYVNHSCDPNTFVCINKTGHVYLIAIRDIIEGEEFFFDYSTTMADGLWSCPCACGSKLCRGGINDFIELSRFHQLRLIKSGIVPLWVIEDLLLRDPAFRESVF